jgi:23S rRNA (adenine2503-C2)-methyltransferase
LIDNPIRHADGVVMNPLGLTYRQFEDEFRRTYGRGQYHAAALYRAFYQSRYFDLDTLPAFQASPNLLEKIRRDFDFSGLSVAKCAVSDGLTKLVFKLLDGLEIETVVIPMATHATVCISSQVGCRMACRFCRTGGMGLRRNLTTSEIVAQVHAARRLLGIEARNVVFMGMGEPLDNFDAVVRAIRIMEDQRGLNIAQRHMTLSTVGLPDGIDALGRLNWSRLRLALSLNAPNDAIRNALMPINHRFPMERLKAALHRYPFGRGGAVFVEYVLIQGVNDRLEHARQLARYLEGVPVKLNLIAYNPGGDAAFEAPSLRTVDRFHRALVEMGLFVRIRGSKGAGIRAACGQLGRN